MPLYVLFLSFLMICGTVLIRKEWSEVPSLSRVASQLNNVYCCLINRDRLYKRHQLRKCVCVCCMYMCLWVYNVQSKRLYSELQWRLLYKSIHNAWFVLDSEAARRAQLCVFNGHWSSWNGIWMSEWKMMNNGDHILYFYCCCWMLPLVGFHLQVHLKHNSLGPLLDYVDYSLKEAMALRAIHSKALVHLWRKWEKIDLHYLSTNAFLSHPQRDFLLLFQI